jgi:hypothetical protein
MIGSQMAAYRRNEIDALADLKRALEEGSTVDKPSFVYTTYIKTTPNASGRPSPTRPSPGTTGAPPSTRTGRQAQR